MVVVEMEEGGEVRECSLKGRDLLVGKKQALCPIQQGSIPLLDDSSDVPLPLSQSRIFRSPAKKNKEITNPCRFAVQVGNGCGCSCLLFAVSGRALRARCDIYSPDYMYAGVE